MVQDRATWPAISGCVRGLGACAGLWSYSALQESRVL